MPLCEPPFAKPPADGAFEGRAAARVDELAERPAHGQRLADETAPASRSLARFPFPAPGTAAGGVDPVWRRALLSRTREHLRRENRSAKARVVLVALLRRAGVDVSLVTIHAWPRRKQGDAYLWAIAFLSGQENLPQPLFLAEATEAGRP